MSLLINDVGSINSREIPKFDEPYIFRSILIYNLCNEGKCKQTAISHDYKLWKYRKYSYNEYK